MAQKKQTSSRLLQKRDEFIPLAKRQQLADWIKENRIDEVECMLSDISGIARGKILPAQKFLDSIEDLSLRLPMHVCTQLVTGDMIDSDTVDETEPDMILLPDPDSIRLVPWYDADERTACIICDPYHRDTLEPLEISPRNVLKRILRLYQDKGWRPVVAPELEFYLSAVNTDADYPLEPPVGRSGRQETGRQAYGIDAVNEFDPLFEDVYEFCEAQRLDIDTLIHEAGAAQVEINFEHGDPVDIADQAFLFKRTVRQAALKHGIYATFMAKPYADEPGSAMHLHQSVISTKTGKNVFSDRNGKDTRLFLNHIGGLQKYLPAAMPIFAPNVNSYRRLVRYLAAPINTYWGHENRTVGLRVPVSEANARRIENRVPGADANPYLAMAASLACGYIGMVEKIKPSAPVETSAYDRRFALPRYILDAVQRLRYAPELKETLGQDFCTLLMEVRLAEHDAFLGVISPWEREHLLLNV